MKRIGVQGMGKRVLALRKARRLSQRRVAALAGVSDREVGYVENDEKRRVSAEVIGRLAVALGTSADFLLGLTEDPTPPPSFDGPAQPLRLAGLVPVLEHLGRLPPERRREVVEAVLVTVPDPKGLRRSPSGDENL